MRDSNRFLSRYGLIATSVIGTLVLTACSPHSPKHAIATGSTSEVQLFFNKGSSTLTDAANQRLDQAARLYRDGDPIGMFIITGYADSSGGEYDNLVLSGQRAWAAKEALVARGIPAARLRLQAVGSSLSSDLKTLPPENNRRVVITWR